MSRISKNKTCEANGCYNKATNQTTLNVGRHGSIELNLCKSCIPEFRESIRRSASDQETNQDHIPVPVRMINGKLR